MLIAAGLMISITVGGVWFLVNLLWFIAVGKWIDFPLFIGYFLAMVPLLYAFARLKRRFKDEFP